VFDALGLRNGQLLAGVTDVIESRAWPEQRASIHDWIETLAAVPNDLESPALRVEPVIGEVLAALRAADGTLLARMSGSGATCFAIFGNESDARRASQRIQLEHSQWWVHAGTLS
jgi:4-diphosphocytidyl-2-C-methyl-D-erythritol kinase